MSRTLRILSALSVFSAATLGFTAEAAAQVNLPFLEDWEGTNGETYATLTASLAGAPEWSYEPLTAGGRLRMAAGTGFYNDGSAAATLDRDSVATTTIINYLTLSLDMSNYVVPQDNVVLDFSHMQHGDESSTNDRVWVRGSSTDTFVELYNLTIGGPLGGQYQQVIDVDITNTLATAGQQFSSTFQLRFGQEDNFPATTVTGTDGRTFDSIVVRRVLNNDMTIQDVTMPADQSCGQTMHDVEVQVLNAGANTQANIPVMVTVSGDINASFMGTVVGPVVKNQTATVIVGQINTYPGANITIDAQVMLPMDDDTANDSMQVTRFIKPTEIAIPPVPSVCPGDAATIAVTPEPLATFELYDAEMGGNLLDTGDMLATPPVDMLTTFWVERINATLAGGAVDNTIGMGANYGTFSDGLVFDVASPIILHSVYAYPSSSGQVQVTLRDSGDNVIGSSAVYLVQPADVGMKTEIPVGVTVPIGSGFRLTAEGSTTALYRNFEGAAYPYSISTWVNITGNTPNLPSAYYFFYDWQVSENVPVCSSERTPVDVDVDASLCSADLVVDMTGPDMADPGATVEYVVTVTNNGPTVAAGTSVDMATPAGFTFVSNSGDCANAYPCDLGDMPSGAMATITSSYTVNDDFDGTASFTAGATSGSTEANPGDEDDTVMTTVMNTMGVGGGGGGTVGSGGAGGGTTTTGAGGGTTSSSGSGGGDTGDDGGCSCTVAGTSDDGSAAALALLFGGLAFAGARRRRRRR